jgi:adenylate cyclase
MSTGESVSAGQVERRLAAIFAADVEGYSRLMGIDEVATLRALTAHRAVMDGLIAQHRGRIANTAGDSVVAEFPSVVDAVECAVVVQQAIAAANAAEPEDRRMRFRISINLGDVLVKDGDLFGDGVNVAARLQALAEPGGICVSGTVRDHVGRKLAASFADLGEHVVKNIAEPVRVYRVRPTGDASPAAVGSLPLPEKPSIAVLPFQNMSGDPDQEYFADGIAEEITTALARLPWLFVIARNSSFTYKGKPINVKQVGIELGVRYVMEGSVRKAGDRVRITGQLIDATNGAHIWADRFDGTLDAIFDLQDKVASSVVGAIEPRLRLSEIERAKRKPTERLDAYDLYLRALAQIHRLTPDATESAISLALQAIEIDSAYAPAAALAGWCRAVQKWQGWIKPQGAEYTDGIRLARLAIASGVEDPDTLWMAGHTLAYLAGDHAGARVAIGRALALNINSAHAWGAKGLVESYLGEADVAIDAFQRATRLSPLDPLLYHYKFGIALGHLRAGHYEIAMEWVDKALSEQPQFSAGYRVKLALFGLLSRAEEGRPTLARLLELQPGLTVAGFATHAATFLSAEMTNIMVSGLRKAGLPE